MPFHFNAELGFPLYLSPPRVFLVQVAILANRMNGRDTHLRALKVLAPEPP